MKSGKRMLAGILTVIMVLASVQFPGGVSYAEELPAAQETVAETPAGQEEAPRQEEGQTREDGADGDACGWGV